MIPAPVTQLVNQRSIRMEIEDDRLIGGKQGIEVPVGKPMWMFGFRHKPEKVNDVDKPYLEIRKALLQNRDRRQRLHGCNIAGASHYNVGVLAIVSGCPVPNTDALGAMRLGVSHAQVLQVFLLIGDDRV